MQITAELERRVRTVAHLSCPLPGLCEEFAQEMRLALLLLSEGERPAWCIARAKSRALDWARRQFRHRDRIRRASLPAASAASATETALSPERRAAAVGWHLLDELDRILDQDRAVLATNLGWE